MQIQRKLLKDTESESMGWMVDVKGLPGEFVHSRISTAGASPRRPAYAHGRASNVFLRLSCCTLNNRC